MTREEEENVDIREERKASESCLRRHDCGTGWVDLVRTTVPLRMASVGESKLPGPRARLASDVVRLVSALVYGFFVGTVPNSLSIRVRNSKQ